MSVRWRHCIDHADTKQKPLMRPDCLLGVVPQPTDSRLSETTQLSSRRSSAADRHSVKRDSALSWFVILNVLPFHCLGEITISDKKKHPTWRRNVCTHACGSDQNIDVFFLQIFYILERCWWTHKYVCFRVVKITYCEDKNTICVERSFRAQRLLCAKQCVCLSI